VKDRAEAYERHVRDSLALLPVLDVRMEAALVARGAAQAYVSSSAYKGAAPADSAGGAAAEAHVSGAAHPSGQPRDKQAANGLEDSTAARAGAANTTEETMVCSVPTLHSRADTP
jgi:hypothetical protein